ncbi:PREDICTED: uncharacterized protein LOC104592947 [Nelumbo nucifera]|uniref:Uncharacterized protein LOC104592947 n=2 Tax=Nelumbo nucifera TaxID=4432 RepID=A0A1U7ZQ66_NELNU|nr:PREDICTED: uncharacterized protein LOC104592947 [Nelumbo nucifera]DAD34312.1 TPA_asm: hypothetical protein HUJ06_004952 [Nelumbo nucifera]
MDGRGGCCIARYDDGGYDMSKVDRIMLRFRPIAPKPAVGGSFTGTPMPENKDVSVRTERAKRRYNRRGNNKRCNRKKRAFLEEKKDGLKETVVTLLPLLPETPEPKDLPLGRSSDLDLNVNITTTNLKTPANYVPIPTMSFNNRKGKLEACIDGEGLGRTDEEKKKNLEKDICPGFISDGFNKVVWMNEAYRRMVSHGEQGESGSEMLWLVTKERLPVTYPEFACRLRLQHNYRKDKNSILTVPCDVWRMDDGGFAWRLDVKAALSLGR